MKKRLMIVLAVGALMAVMLPGAASAGSITEGRPGQFEMERISFNGSAGSLSPSAGLCSAKYVDTVLANTFISNSGGADATIKVKENKNGIRATCKFTDTSGVYEGNAEVGYSDNCTLYVDGGAYVGGSGRVTAAANNAADTSNGGNVSFHCKWGADAEFVPLP